MTIAISSPVTGGAQTGFTSPTYTLTTDTAPSVFGKQWAVTALGGTQVGVRVHAASDPFTVTYVRPASFKVLGKPNPTTGLLPNVPKNTHLVIVRKGALPMAAQPSSIALLRASIDIPAGSDTADPAQLRAMISLLSGILAQAAFSSGLGDTLVSGLS